jgi:microsomal dipeptidase-like Zn-dependent dipeptidase
VVAGIAFAGQPVSAETIGAADVIVDGRQAVMLGGDYWHTTAYPLGHHGRSLIRVVTASSDGVLDSAPFTISERYLAYRIGGSAGGGAALEFRIPAGTARNLRRPALDKPDADEFVAIVIVTPHGSDLLDEGVIDLDPKGAAGHLTGATAKVRLRVSVANGPQRLLVDHIRLVGKRPPPFRRPLWGWADIHCHPMAQAGFGDLLAGHIHGPVGDIGSCLPLHGHEHGNVLHPTGLALDGGRHNDGSLAGTGWSTTVTPGPEEQGFRGWPAFDEITHLKTHQDWIRRAYDGGLRLMVALVVHNQLLAAVSTALTLDHVQSDRDAVEPQVHMLREFVAHNRDWCGLATTPAQARDLIEHNKMAFVLGLETDSINGWSRFTDLPNVEDDATRADVRQRIHDQIHGYFEYLHNLGIVQVNLIHLSDNAFGGMALYDVMFVINTLARTGRLPQVENGFLDATTHLPRPAGEAISLPVTVESALWEKLAPLAMQLGFSAPPLPGNGVYGHGDRNAIGLLPAGEEAVLEAMRFGMVVDMDHMSERATAQANVIATTGVPNPPYPLVAAHNGARTMAMDPPAQLPPPGAVPGTDERRNPHTWPNESTKSETQLGHIQSTGGMFGHGIAGADSKPFGSAVANDAPGTSKTVAQGLQYVMERLGMPVGLGTDWNALLGGPGPRFGPMAVPGLLGELEPHDAWAAAVRAERWGDAMAQTNAVAYDKPLADWRSYRFQDSGLDADQSYAGDGRFIWQAFVLRATGVDLTSPTAVDALQKSGGQPALDIALGLTGGAPMTTSVYFQAGAQVRDPTSPATGSPADVTRIMNLVNGINELTVLWNRVNAPGTAPPLTRSTAGPIRDFDYNLDGLAHYGMLPDMLQDLRNVGLPAKVFTSFFASAERYIQVWERSVAVAATIPHPPVKAP